MAAIDYDGYVNTTKQSYIDGALMKYVLGGIVETYQTVTRENHIDSGALMKHVPGDIEARQAEIILDVVSIISHLGCHR